MKWMFACAALVALMGCTNDTRGGGGGDLVVTDPDGTCDGRGTSIPLCNDYDVDDDDVSFFEMICMGSWSTTTPCDPAGACGWCAQPMDGFDATTYYYPGSGPEADSAEQCETVGGTWIDEPSVTCE